MNKQRVAGPVEGLRRSILSRTTQFAIAAVGCLAEIHRDPDRRLSAREIAESRDLRGPFLGKVLSALSRAKIIQGTRGPGGGFRLTRDPSKITLKEIANLFEREDTAYMCPYGKDYCGSGPKCPLHDQMETINKSMERFLESTTLAGFQQRTRRKAR